MIELFETHRRLVERSHFAVRRRLLDRIDPSVRLTAIAGERGIGKTAILLVYARENYRPADKRCLYVNLENFYFASHPLRDFASDFVCRGGQVLLLDGINNVHEWWNELDYCIRNLPNLKIIFTVSLAVKFGLKPFDSLAENLQILHLRGLSFREYLEFATGYAFEAVPLEELLNNHQDISADICAKIKPLAFFDDYLSRGYYPFFTDKRSFHETLVRNVNLTFDADLTALTRLDPAKIHFARNLLAVLASQNSRRLNISHLSKTVGLSRLTTAVYLQTLHDVGLICLLHNSSDCRKIFSHVCVNNTNLQQIISNESNTTLLAEIFFCNQIFPAGLAADDADGHFLVSGKYLFSVGEKIRGKFDPDCYYAIAGIERGEQRVIPLWMLGLTY
jgi:predicted AAA+ superfamily ATPase